MHGSSLSVRELRFGYEKSEVLRGVDLRVASGECVVVLGPNGAGKSTLLKCVNRILEGATGEVEVNGTSISGLSQRELAAQVAYVPQSSGGSMPFTVTEFMELARYPYGRAFATPTAEDHEAVRAALQATDALGFLDRRIDTLSGGERQRVSIASALAQGAELLLLDEPTTFLDYKHQAEVLALLDELKREREQAMLAVTHDARVALRLADRVVGLKNGQVVFDVAPEAALRDRLLDELYETPFDVVHHRGTGTPIAVDREAGA